MKFTPKEMSILACLMASDDYVTTDRLHHALYGTRTAAPSKNAVYVFIARLTNKLRTIGFASTLRNWPWIERTLASPFSVPAFLVAAS